MALFPFYSQRTPRRFEHKPIYYDPRKEELEERKLKVRRELGLEAPPEEYQPQIRGKFFEGTKHLKKSQENGENSHSWVQKSGKLVLFALLLIIIFWFLIRG